MKAAATVFAAVALSAGAVSASAAVAQPSAAGPSISQGSMGTAAAKGVNVGGPARVKALAPASATPTATGALSTVVSMAVHGGYTAAGIGMRNLGYGTIGITGIPVGAKVKSATLLWDILADQQTPAFAQGIFAGHAITGTAWSSGPSPCWPVSANWSYEANVSKMVHGNGSYSLSAFASGQTDGEDPWTASAPPLDEGASLVVIYQLASMPETVVQIAEGASETDLGHQVSATLTGFTATPKVSAKTTYIVADGQESGNTAAFDGATLPGVGFPGADPQAVPDYSMGNLWDTVTVDASSQVKPYDTTASVGVTGNSDCLVWVGQVLAVTSIQALVAMGDSYSSGEANPPFDPGTATLFDTCHRSAKAWPQVLATTDPTISMEAFIACSGATTADLTTDSFKTEPPQIVQLKALPQPTDMPRLITVTIGGNDVGFSSVVTDCYISFLNCDGRVAQARQYIQSVLPGVLTSTYAAIRQADPKASVAVVGYPRLLPESQADVHGCAWLSDAKRIELNDLSTLLNTVIGTAAHTAGFTYVPTLNALNGHEECVKTDSWLYPIGQLPFVYDAHPRAAGQQAIEAVVQKALG